MMKNALTFLAALVFFGAGMAHSEEPRAEKDPAMSPEEFALARHVSQVLFQVQREERDAAAPLELSKLAEDMEKLKRALRRFAWSELNEKMDISRGGAKFRRRAEARERRNRSRFEQGLTTLANRRKNIEAHLNAVQGTRQEEVARRAIRMIAAIEADGSRVLAADPRQRRRESMDLARHLEPVRYGLANGGKPGAKPAPTVFVHRPTSFVGEPLPSEESSPSRRERNR